MAGKISLLSSLAPLPSRVGCALLGICFLTSFVMAQKAVGNLRPGKNQISIEFEGRQRSALLCLPVRHSMPESGWPLVLMLHGAGGSSANVIESTGWDLLGEAEGVVTLFPNGTPRDEGRPENFWRNPQTWNSGATESLSSGRGSAATKQVNDVDFLDSLIRLVWGELKIDRRRIYVAGHSNGAGMAYRLAFERPGMVAAVGVMAGHFFQNPREMRLDVSLIQLLGERDPFAPLEGGDAGILWLRMNVPPALNAPETWARMIGASIRHDTLQVDRDLVVLRWGPSPTGAEVKSIQILGHGHGWPRPGHTPRLPEFLAGPDRPAIDATREIWTFFRAHPRLD